MRAVYRCSCGAVATHKVEVQLVATGDVPADHGMGTIPEVRWGVFSPQHIMSLAAMKREYAKAGLEVIDYEIQEIWSVS